MQIRRSGGRTTYYGRLRPDMPSYTINTYFNRPGNGTFIHPEQHRLISRREAARLQSFPDRYRFLGPPSSRYKQIGNAVPPLMARAIGMTFPPSLAVDTFAGAGGLSEGLRQAGHRVVVATDVDTNMCATYSYNHRDTRVVQADLMEKGGMTTLIECVEDSLHGRTLGLLAGSPPCQGFSLAGKWEQHDPRNLLVDRFLECVAVLAPERVLLENVPGLLSFRGGAVLSHVVGALCHMGYSVHYEVLRAEQFGVPQRRRRVFVMGLRSGDEPQMPVPEMAYVPRGRKGPDGQLPADARGLPPPVTVGEAISDLPPIAAGGGQEVMEYDSRWVRSDYQRVMRGLLSTERFFAGRPEQD